MTIDLYCFDPSPPCWTVRILAKQLGIRLNLHEINVLKGDQFKDHFMKLNPKHTIPTIDDNGFVVWESRAILIYLAMKYAKNDSLYPTDLEKRAIVEQRINFDLGYLNECVANYIYPVIMGSPAPPEECLAPLDEAFQTLDGLLQDSDFVAGDDITVADYGLMSTVCSAKAGDYNIDQYENVSAWYDRCKEVMEKYGFEEIAGAGMKMFNGVYKSNLQVDE
ncbi:hypothetical protein QAD02_017747 [Eretmocerus hayati]|uniref:Uncharacterized protein n=1 Tax=Eretmocerus hayati TaxID=131215 RepID=A0ACC2PEH8_9HYME|nr:hypothetical protein QAD02_017747 [Eretmocerus hayati]